MSYGQPERRFGRYELLEVLGQGGFATVYRARDAALGRDVAVKALLPHLAADADVRSRFLAEGQALAGLRHPNIVTVYDVGEANGQPFFAMELIEGQTLGTLIAGDRSVEPAYAAAMLHSLCSAVDYLHAAGIIHRDIKPANVMVDGAGRAVLMDFGIARSLDQTQHTVTGASLGTPQYMAPEQVRGETAGPAADIYALGTLAYQLFAGRPPFEGDTAYVLHAQAYEAPTPLQQLCPGLPASVYAAIDGALAKMPTARPRTAGTFAAALAGDLELPPSPSSLPGKPAHRLPLKLVLTAAGALAALILMGIIVLMAASGGHGPTTDASTQTAAAAANSVRTLVTTSPPATAITPLPVPTSAGDSTDVPRTTREITVTATPPVPAVVPLTATPAPALQVSDFRVDQIDAWASGQADLRGCFSYENASGADGLRIRLARPDDRSVPLADGPLTPLGGGAGGPVCGTVPTGQPQPAGTYVALLYDQRWQPRGEYLFSVQAPLATVQPAPPPLFHINQLVRANTPNDCLLLRFNPVASEATGRVCLPDGGHVRVLAGPELSNGVALWKVTRWNGADSEGGWARQDYLAASPDCDQRRDSASCDTAVATPKPTPPPTRTPTTVPTRMPTNAPAPPQPTRTPSSLSVAGDWELTDHIQYGSGQGEARHFTVHLAQNGTQVTGSSTAFSLSGQLNGRTLSASLKEGSTNGEFRWTFTADGTRFEGAYASGFGNGGTSYGRRSTGTVSTADQATVFVVGPGVTGDRVRTNSDAYACFTVSAASHIILTSTVTGGFTHDTDDDGSGDCILMNTKPETAGSRTFRLQMSISGRMVAESQTTVTVGP